MDKQRRNAIITGVVLAVMAVGVYFTVVLRMMSR